MSRDASPCSVTHFLADRSRDVFNLIIVPREDGCFATPVFRLSSLPPLRIVRSVSDSGPEYCHLFPLPSCQPGPVSPRERPRERPSASGTPSAKEPWRQLPVIRETGSVNVQQFGS